MVTKHLVKDEIDNIPEEHLSVLYKIVLALEDSGGSASPEKSADSVRADEKRLWGEFVAATYGCLADDPIQRGDQGRYEDRGLLR